MLLLFLRFSGSRFFGILSYQSLVFLLGGSDVGLIITFVLGFECLILFRGEALLLFSNLRGVEASLSVFYLFKYL